VQGNDGLTIVLHHSCAFLFPMVTILKSFQVHIYVHVLILIATTLSVNSLIVRVLVNRYFLPSSASWQPHV
jgi:hypothetical protein